MPKFILSVNLCADALETVWTRLHSEFIVLNSEKYSPRIKVIAAIHHIEYFNIVKSV